MLSVIVEMRTSMLVCLRTPGAFLEKNDKIFSGFRKEQELSSWEPSAYIVFMHELLTIDITPFYCPCMCCSIPSQMCHLTHLVVYL